VPYPLPSRTNLPGVKDLSIGDEFDTGLSLHEAFSEVDVFHGWEAESLLKAAEAHEGTAQNGEVAGPKVSSGLVDRAFFRMGCPGADGCDSALEYGDVGVLVPLPNVRAEKSWRGDAVVVEEEEQVSGCRPGSVVPVGGGSSLRATEVPYPRIELLDLRGVIPLTVIRDDYVDFVEGGFFL